MSRYALLFALCAMLVLAACGGSPSSTSSGNSNTVSATSASVPATAAATDQSGAVPTDSSAAGADTPIVDPTRVFAANADPETLVRGFFAAVDAKQTDAALALVDDSVSLNLGDVHANGKGEVKSFLEKNTLTYTITDLLFTHTTDSATLTVAVSDGTTLHGAVSADNGTITFMALGNLPTAANASAPTTAPTNQSASSTNSGAGVPVGDIHAVLQKACDALQAQPNISIHSVTTGVTTADTTIQFEGHDKMALNESLGGRTIATTVISPTVYTNENGKWTKRSSASGAATMIGLIRLPVYAGICLDETASGTDTPEYTIDSFTSGMAMPELLNGIPTLTYVVNGEYNSEAGKSSGTIKYWLGATDSLPYKFTIDYTDTKGQKGSSVGTYTYNAPDIQAPIP